MSNDTATEAETPNESRHVRKHTSLLSANNFKQAHKDTFKFEPATDGELARILPFPRQLALPYGLKHKYMLSDLYVKQEYESDVSYPYAHSADFNDFRSLVFMRLFPQLESIGWFWSLQSHMCIQESQFGIAFRQTNISTVMEERKHNAYFATNQGDGNNENGSERGSDAIIMKLLQLMHDISMGVDALQTIAVGIESVYGHVESLLNDKTKPIALKCYQFVQTLYELLYCSSVDVDVSNKVGNDENDYSDWEKYLAIVFYEADDYLTDMLVALCHDSSVSSDDYNPDNETQPWRIQLNALFNIININFVYQQSSLDMEAFKKGRRLGSDADKTDGQRKDYFKEIMEENKVPFIMHQGEGDLPSSTFHAFFVGPTITDSRKELTLKDMDILIDSKDSGTDYVIGNAAEPLIEQLMNLQKGIDKPIDKTNPPRHRGVELTSVDASNAFERVANLSNDTLRILGHSVGDVSDNYEY